MWRLSKHAEQRDYGRRCASRRGGTGAAGAAGGTWPRCGDSAPSAPAGVVGRWDCVMLRRTGEERGHWPASLYAELHV